MMPEIEPLPAHDSDQEAQQPADGNTAERRTTCVPQREAYGSSNKACGRDMSTGKTVSSGQCGQGTGAHPLDTSLEQFAKKTTNEHDEDKMAGFSPPPATTEPEECDSSEHEQRSKSTILQDEHGIVERTGALSEQPLLRGDIKPDEPCQPTDLDQREREAKKRKNTSHAREEKLKGNAPLLVERFDSFSPRPFHIVAVAVCHLFQKGSDFRWRTQGEHLLDFSRHPGLPVREQFNLLLETR